MSNSLNARSLQRLEGVHPDLVRIATRAAELSDVPFQITEGLRSLARQRELVRKGASRTLNSRHLSGHAIDVVAYVGSRISWEAPLYYRIADAFKTAAAELGLSVEWGGDWKSFFDAPHFQLPWASYPASANPAAKRSVPTVSPRADARAAHIIRPGQKGEEVRALQEVLREHIEPHLATDGHYGPATYRAVVALQQRLGVAADGVIGQKTRVALDRWLSAKPVPLLRTRFDICLDLVLESEGGFTDHPDDAGGPTNYGITLETLSAWRGSPQSRQHVEDLTRDEAAKIYRARYWNAIRADELPSGLDYALFDFAVNSGPARAVSVLQTALSAKNTSHMDDATLKAVWGAVTVAGGAGRLIDAVCVARLDYLRERPNWRSFGRGWTARVQRVREQAQAMVDVPKPQNQQEAA